MSKVKGPWIALILHLLSLCVFLLQIANPVSGEYVEQYLESVEVCTSAAVGPFSSIAKKRIRLQNYPNNTVVVKLTRWEEFWPSFLNFRCKFQVIAPKKFGVMVVIQSLHLRKKNATEASCRDWIKFEQDDGFKTGQICGDLDDNNFEKSPESIIGPRYFYDANGQIDVSFSTGDHKPAEAKKPIFLKMIFTAYQDCSEMAISHGKIKRCSSIRSSSCIASNLFCDGEINCGFSDADFGADERNCEGSGRNGKSSDGFSDRPASVYVFAITCIATLFVVVIFVFFACCCIRRYGTRYQSPSHNLASFQERMEFQASHLPAIAVTSDINEKTQSKDDPPPNYDELYPVSSKH